MRVVRENGPEWAANRVMSLMSSMLFVSCSALFYSVMFDKTIHATQFTVEPVDDSQVVFD